MKVKESVEKSQGEGFRNAYDYIVQKESRSKNGILYSLVLRMMVIGLEKDGYKVTIEKV